MAKNLLTIFTITLFLGMFVTTSQAKDAIQVKLNNEPITFDEEPFIEDGRTLVPIRAITEAMDCDVDWDSNTKTALISSAGHCISIRIGSRIIEIANQLQNETGEIEIDVPAKIYGDRTFVPLRAISEAFGAEVDWDGDKKLVTIQYDIPKDSSRRIYLLLQ